MLASQEGHCEVVELLIANGALVNLKEKSGRSALTMAKDQHIAKLLLHQVEKTPSLQVKDDTSHNEPPSMIEQGNYVHT